MAILKVIETKLTRKFYRNGAIYYQPTQIRERVDVIETITFFADYSNIVTSEVMS